MINRAYISINNVCNLHCSYCSFRAINTINDDDAFTDSELSLILSNILSYVEKNQLEKFVIGICGAGEPLLNFNQISNMVLWAEKNDPAKSLHFYTITNGTIITDDMIAFFFKYKDRIDLNFSLDGYEELHNIGKAKYKDAREGLKKYKDTFGEYPIIQCTVTKQTILNKEKLAAFFENEGFLRVNFGFLFDINDPELKINYSEYLQFLKFIAENTTIIARQNKKRKKYDCRIYGNYCSVGRNNPFITKTGVYPCCRFYKNEEYNMAAFDDKLDRIEKRIAEYTPVPEGACYFDTHIKQNTIR